MLRKFGPWRSTNNVHPQLSFSWAQGATKNRSIHHNAPVVYFHTTKAISSLSGTHRFLQCMKTFFLH